MINTDNLWEVRVNLGSNIFRLLCFFDGSEIIVLTHAFQKKTQKLQNKRLRLLKNE